MGGNAGCTRCGGPMEDVNHVLRFCKYAQSVWCQIAQPPDIQGFGQLQLQEWMHQNLIRTQPSLAGGISWATLFGLTCWKLWETRNKAVFQDAHTPPETLHSIVMGVLKRDPLIAGAGCILRDDTGEWLGGSCRMIGTCTSLQAELWARDP
ncbi:hypothetical protein K1719_028743 [Acacia pycnantha]|nr:hypothetical protein K1719_028743 [Acacia pycnantha]